MKKAGAIPPFSLLLASCATAQAAEAYIFASIALFSNSVQVTLVKPIDGESKWFSPRRTYVAVKLDDQMFALKITSLQRSIALGSALALNMAFVIIAAVVYRLALNS
jgi:hypothetical protein